MGWWRPALKEQTRIPYKWPLIAPVILFIGAITNLISTDWSKFDGSLLLALLLLGLFVGFCEEMILRGLMITALRSRLSEGWVCINRNTLGSLTTFIASPLAVIFVIIMLKKYKKSVVQA